MTEIRNRFSVLRDPDFVRFAASRFLSTAALLMQSVAVGWQVYDRTGRPTDLGYVGLAQFLPFVVFILVSGQVADRRDRMGILIACSGAYLAGSLSLLAYTVSGIPSVLPIFGILVLLGTARAFAMPAGQAIVRNIVAPADFQQAVAFNSTAFHVAVVAGPVAGGFLYLAGPVAVHATVSVLLVAATLLQWGVRTRPVGEVPSPPTWRAALEGFRFVWSRPVILGAISLDLFAVLFGGATALLPAIARDVLHADTTALGFLRASPALGAAATTLVLAWRPIRRDVGSWMFGGVALFGLSTIGFGLSRNLAVSMGCLFLLGVGDMVSVFIRHILVQTQTPDALRGRVSAVNSVFIGASNELGEFESGTTAGWFGLVPSVLVGGAMTILVTVSWMGLFPVLRKMDAFPADREGA